LQADAVVAAVVDDDDDAAAAATAACVQCYCHQKYDVDKKWQQLVYGRTQICRCRLLITAPQAAATCCWYV